MELTNFKEIKDIILKRWKKGDILREYFREKYNKDFLIFPWKIKLKSPTSKELSTNTLEVFNWKKALKETDKSVLAYGYNIIEKKINNKIIGKNSIPTHIEILYPEDAIKLIKKEKEVSLFSKNLSFILNKYSELEDWIEKNIFELLREKEEWEKILIVVEYFINNPITREFWVIIRFGIQVGINSNIRIYSTLIRRGSSLYIKHYFVIKLFSEEDLRSSIRFFTCFWQSEELKPSC